MIPFFPWRWQTIQPIQINNFISTTEQLNEIELFLNRLTGEVNKLGADYGKFKDGISDIVSEEVQRQVTTINGHLLNIDEAIQNISLELDIVKKTMSEQGDEITDLQGLLASLESHVEFINGEIIDIRVLALRLYDASKEYTKQLHDSQSNDIRLRIMTQTRLFTSRVERFYNEFVAFLKSSAFDIPVRNPVTNAQSSLQAALNDMWRLSHGLMWVEIDRLNLTWETIDKLGLPWDVVDNWRADSPYFLSLVNRLLKPEILDLYGQRTDNALSSVDYYYGGENGWSVDNLKWGQIEILSRYYDVRAFDQYGKYVANGIYSALLKKDNQRVVRLSMPVRNYSRFTTAGTIISVELDFANDNNDKSYLVESKYTPAYTTVTPLSLIKSDKQLFISNVRYYAYDDGGDEVQMPSSPQFKGFTISGSTIKANFYMPPKATSETSNYSLRLYADVLAII